MSTENTSVTLENTLPVIQPFTPENLPAFGNQVLSALINQVAFDDELNDLMAKAEASRQFTSFELTRAMLYMHENDEKLNLYAVWEGGKATEKLNNRVLQAMGVIRREASTDDDKIITIWTDKSNESLYNYAAVDKEKEAPEHKRRFDNRKRLNIALSNAYKAAIALIDGGTKAADLKITEDEATGVVVATIDNAPKEIAGESAGGKVEFGKRTVATGATQSPTLASLVKIATAKHKADEGETVGTGERADKGGERSGDAKIAISDEDFGGMVNNLKRTISAQENVFTPDMIKQMKSLIPILTAATAPKKADA